MLGIFLLAVLAALGIWLLTFAIYKPRLNDFTSELQALAGTACIVFGGCGATLLVCLMVWPPS